jgi:zinc protease
MHQREIEQQNIRGISISRAGERAFHCVISIDTHTTQTNSQQEAIGLVYIKALLAGCEGYTREEFLNAVNLLGATLHASIDNGIITITLTSIDTNRDKLITLAALMVTKPTFSPKEITRIVELTQNELHEEKEDAKTQAIYGLVNALYGEKDRRHVTKTDTVISLLPNVTKKDLQSFHTHAMKGRWIFTLISDSAQEEKVVSKILKLRTSFGDTKEAIGGQQILSLSKPKVELLSIPSKQNIELNIGGSLPLHLTEKDYYAFLFGLNVLGKWGGFAGRLMSIVREKEGLTYGIYARTETVTQSEYGYWKIMTFFAPDKVVQGIQSTLREIKKIKEKGITQNEYDRFKMILATGQALLHDSILSTASITHAYQLKGLSSAEIAAHQKNMFEVSITEVNAALKKYIDLSRLVISAAGPVQAKSKELKALQSLEQ